MVGSGSAIKCSRVDYGVREMHLHPGKPSSYCQGEAGRLELRPFPQHLPTIDFGVTGACASPLVIVLGGIADFILGN
jgi:hypothetical protein